MGHAHPDRHAVSRTAARVVSAMATEARMSTDLVQLISLVGVPVLMQLIPIMTVLVLVAEVKARLNHKE
jgi:hypothetical protein